MKIQCLFVAVCLSLTLACSNSKSTQPNADTQAASQTSAQPAQSAPTVAPQSLKDTGELAENIYDAAAASQWKTASDKLTSLNDALTKLKTDSPNASQLGDIESHSSALQKDISAKSKLPTMIDANEITRLAAELSARFPSTIPVQVVMLDYLGRKLQIESMQHNLTSLKQTASDVQRNWTEIRAQLEQKNAGKEIKGFDMTVHELGTATSVTRFAQLAKKELDQVDGLENAFTR